MLKEFTRQKMDVQLGMFMGNFYEGHLRSLVILIEDGLVKF